jgi:hypothetical protein
MIVVTIDIIPLGVDEERKTLGQVKIEDDLTGTSENSNYRLEYASEAMLAESHIENYPRKKGFLPLVVKSLNKFM